MFMASLIRPLLNGPVTLSLSILFGTLVAMTIQTLYNRQVNIHKMLVGSVEEMRELSLYLCGFPEPHRRQGRLYLESYLTLNMRAVHENSFSPVSLRSQSEMGSFLLMLNAMSGNKGSKDDGSLVVEPPAYLSEVYTSVHRLKVIRSELTSTLFSAFPWFHYANMVILAAALLFVFLLETDQEAMQFLVGFQLSLCWALLIGTYAMLGVVMYDLATPFTGFFSVVKGSANDRNQTRSYALALDLASTHPDDS